MHLFIAGLLAMAYLVAALFFLRFWRESRDRLFALFSLSFAMLAAHRALAALFSSTDMVFVIRLLAFLLILLAILDKNRTATVKRPPSAEPGESMPAS